jgi:hypothetical protein
VVVVVVVAPALAALATIGAGVAVAAGVAPSKPNSRRAAVRWAATRCAA